LRFKNCHGAHADSATVDQPRASRSEVLVNKAQLPRESRPEIAALRSIGEAAIREGNLPLAESAWKQILEQKSDNAEALFYLGNIARTNGDPDGAADFLQKATASAPSNPGIRNNLGLVLEALGRFDDAESQFREAANLSGGAFDATANLAQNLYQQGRFREALEYFDRLVHDFDVSVPAIWANRGVCQINLGDSDGARQSILKAISQDESSPALRFDLGNVYSRERRFEDAEEAYDLAVKLDPNHGLAASGRLFCRQNLAIWDDFPALRATQIARASSLAGRRDQVVAPYPFLTICDDPALQLEVAKGAAATKVIRSCRSVRRQSAKDGCIRLGFVSSNLHEHPVGRLVIELIERLDRSQCESTLYALGPGSNDNLRGRFRKAATCFREFETWTPLEIAKCIEGDRIDVLFDLNGHTDRPLLDIFVQRPAALQLNYLGYTGTLGCPVYDGIIVDRFCVPSQYAQFLSEHPIYMDGCYLPSDSTRAFDPTCVSRDQYHLDSKGIVLCAFGATYKILPDVFGKWCELLTRHPNALLWLRDAGSATNGRLRKEANCRGVAAERLVFAPIEPTPAYLARFRLADLFLDTVPFGSHTTVNDALFAGLPVVALAGASFAGRASASQLMAVGLGELVAGDLDEYFQIASQLIGDSGYRMALTDRLRLSAPTSDLFDMQRYVLRFQQQVVAAMEDWISRFDQPKR
jgi:predicted O-linked N-acetylglucosamine transferase (SPINDLY family)